MAGEPRPLSYPQQRMWFMEQLAPGSFTNNTARAYRLRGSLDVPRLHRALERLVERHAVLRTVVTPEGREPRQIALDDWELRLPVGDVEEAQLSTTLRDLAREPFDLTRDLPFRASVLRLGDDDHVLLLRMHHIMGDAASDAILFRELAEVYARPDVELPELPVQYADFAASQRAQQLDDLVAHWVRYLEGAPPSTRLPIDRPRPDIQRHVGARYQVAIPAVGVAGLARAQNATSFMTLLAALATLLYRRGADDDVVIGTPMANRNRAELLNVVGFFSNTVPVRVRLGGSPTFAQVLARTRESVLDALAHQDLPFEKIVEALRLPRELASNPVFQVNFRARAEAPPAPDFAGLDVEVLPVDIGFSRFDLALELYPQDGGLAGFWEYDTDLFDRETVAGLAEDYEELLGQVAAEPGREILAVRLPQRAKRAAGITRRRQTR